MAKGPDLLLVPFFLEDLGELLPALRRRTMRSLGLTLEVAEPTFDVAGCYAAARGQHDATALLAMLAQQGGGRRIVGLTDLDLFISIFTFVLGAGQLGGQAAVVSTRRLRPETYGLPPDPGLLEDRVCKELIHELGHTYGLRHCLDPGCVMYASSVADEVDARGPDLKGECLDQLRAIRKDLYTLSTTQG